MKSLQIMQITDFESLENPYIPAAIGRAIHNAKRLGERSGEVFPEGIIVKCEIISDFIELEIKAAEKVADVNGDNVFLEELRKSYTELCGYVGDKLFLFRL